MTTSWIINLLGLFVTSVGALLIFLYLWKSPKFAEVWLTPEGQRAYAKHRHLLVLGVGVLAVWILFQYLSIVFL